MQVEVASPTTPTKIEILAKAKDNKSNERNHGCIFPLCILVIKIKWKLPEIKIAK